MPVLITPLPGHDRESLFRALLSVQTQLGNIGSGATWATDRAFAYLEWMHEARRMLHPLIRPTDLEYLVPSDSYQRVLSAIGALIGHAAGNSPPTRLLNTLVSAQASERQKAFDLALRELDSAVEKLNRIDGQLVVLDTNVYLHHEHKLEEMDLHADLHLTFEPVHLIVPMVVVDELDKAKLSNKGYRAAHALAVIHKATRSGGLMRSSNRSGENPRGEITVQVLLDPAGHVRLPVNDDEIVNRVASVEVLAGWPVKLVTFDTGMAMRAEHAGLRVVKLEVPVEEEKPKRERKRPAPRQGG